MAEHSDHPEVRPQDVRDLTDAEYEATYAEGEPHAVPADVLERIERELTQR